MHIHAGKNAIPANDYFLSILDAFLVDCKKGKIKRKNIKKLEKKENHQRETRKSLKIREKDGNNSADMCKLYKSSGMYSAPLVK